MSEDHKLAVQKCLRVTRQLTNFLSLPESKIPEQLKDAILELQTAWMENEEQSYPISDEKYEHWLANIPADDISSVVSLELPELKQLVMLLKRLVLEEKTVRLSSPAHMMTTSISSTTVPGQAISVGASGFGLRADLLESIDAETLQTNVGTLSSTITLRDQKKSSFTKFEACANPRFLVKIEVYDLETIPPAEVNTQTMWKYAMVHSKFYGSSSNSEHVTIYQEAQEMASQILTIARKHRKRKEEDDLPTGKKMPKRSKKSS